jgi:hypothetical protein
MLYADDIYMLGGSLHTVKKTTKALVTASKEVSIEVYVRKIRIWSCLEATMQNNSTQYILYIYFPAYKMHFSPKNIT